MSLRSLTIIFLLIFGLSPLAGNLTRQLLSFSRRKEINPSVLGLDELIMDMKKMLNRLIGENIQLKTNLQPDLDMIKADPGMLEQVIMNMVINSRDAIKDQGLVTITTSTIDFDQDSAFFLPNTRPGRFICLQVEDDGCGMERQTASRVFEPFFTTKGEDKGTGLGLSVVYGIIKQHQGWINVYSEPGRGTSFKIYLPATSEQSEERISEDICPPRPAAKRYYWWKMKRWYAISPPPSWKITATW